METLALPDGRIIEYTVTGPADGIPLFCHHGTPGSLVQLRAFRRPAHERGLRMVTYSRPGYGGSTRLPGRDVASAAVECEALLEHLHAERCLVVGWSGGGPHALAMAAGLPRRVAAVATLASVAPFAGSDLDFMAGMGEGNLEEFEAALKGERALRSWLEQAAPEMSSGDAAALMEGMASLLPDVDRPLLTAEFGEDLAVSMADALREDVGGWLDDDLAFIRSWGFALEDVTVPCYVWQGSKDLMVPFSHGQWLARHIPGVTAHLLEGEGHLSIVVRGFGRIVDELLEHY